MRSLALAVITWLGLTGPLAAQALCLPTETLAEVLRERWQEAPIGVGLLTDTLLVQVWASADGTFSIVQVRADGISCLVMSGVGWAGPVPDASTWEDPA